MRLPPEKRFFYVASWCLFFYGALVGVWCVFSRRRDDEQVEEQEQLIQYVGYAHVGISPHALHHHATS